MSDDGPIPMPYEKAVAIAAEIATSLGGEQARALEVLIRYAARHRRISQMNTRAVGEATVGALHFVRAQEEIALGLEEVRKASHALRTVELSEREKHPSEPPPRR